MATRNQGSSRRRTAQLSQKTAFELKSRDPCPINNPQLMRDREAYQTEPHTAMLRLQHYFGNRITNHLIESDFRPTIAAQGAIQRSPARVNSLMTTHSDQFPWLEGIAGTCRQYREPLQSLADGGLYFNPDEESEARCVQVSQPVGHSVGNRQYIIDYDFYKIMILIGPAALRGSPENFLGILRHELEHKRQFEEIRGQNRATAAANRAHHEQLGGIRGGIGRFTGDYSTHLEAIVPVDQMDVRVRQATTRAEGVDLSNHATREVLAHTRAFRSIFAASREAGLGQLLPLTRFTPPVGDTPGWSYDQAAGSAKREALENILGFFDNPSAVVYLNDHLIPHLERGQGQARRPSGFLSELLDGCQRQPDGTYVPDPEFALSRLASE